MIPVCLHTHAWCLLAVSLLQTSRLVRACTTLLSPAPGVQGSVKQTPTVSATSHTASHRQPAGMHAFAVLFAAAVLVVSVVGSGSVYDHWIELQMSLDRAADCLIVAMFFTNW